MQGLRHLPWRGQAPAFFHQPVDPHHLPPQRHLGHRQPLPQQGSPAAHGDRARGVCVCVCVPDRRKQTITTLLIDQSKGSV